MAGVHEGKADVRSVGGEVRVFGEDDPAAAGQGGSTGD